MQKKRDDVVTPAAFRGEYRDLEREEHARQIKAHRFTSSALLALLALAAWVGHDVGRHRGEITAAEKTFSRGQSIGYAECLEDFSVAAKLSRFTHDKQRYVCGNFASGETCCWQRP